MMSTIFYMWLWRKIGEGFLHTSMDKEVSLLKIKHIPAQESETVLN